MFFEESVDFINMHYVNNEKDTPFWNNANVRLVLDYDTGEVLIAPITVDRHY